MVTASTRQLELLRSRVEQGAAPLVERDLMDVEVRRLESERLIQAGRTEMALIGLKRLLGMSPASALTLREGLETVVVRESSAGPAIATASAAIDRRPDVREAQARIDAAGARIERARGEGKFDVSVLGSYMRMDSGFPQLGFTSDGMLEPVRGLFHYVSVGAMITVPIFARNQGEIAAAQAERSGAAAAYEAARLGAEAELAASRVEDEYARRALMVYTGGAQKLARQNLSVVSQSYELGRATVSEVLSEQRRYLDLERAFTSALKAAYEARTALNRALGELR
jgi:multidrug efflux system outer membrane protein